MGAKPSTNGSPSEAGYGNVSNLLRAHVSSNDRQRARSLSSVPDLQSSHHHHHSYNNEGIAIQGAGGAPSTPETENNSADDNAASAAANAFRVFTATSLPSHIWSLNGKFYSIPLFSILFDSLNIYTYI